MKLFCEAEVAGFCAGLVLCMVYHNALFNAGVFTSIFRLPNSFRQIGRVTFVAVFKALIMVVEADFELRLATTIIMLCSTS